jgi:hypothetical protein
MLYFEFKIYYFFFKFFSSIKFLPYQTYIEINIYITKYMYYNLVDWCKRLLFFLHHSKNRKVTIY